jgi:ribonuclease HII
MSYDRYGKYYGTTPRTFDRFYRAPLLGIDESGTGAIAGPITVAGVVLPRSLAILDALSEAKLRDSKDLTEFTLESIYQFLLSRDQIEIYTAIARPREIEETNYTVLLTKLYNDVCTQFRAKHSGGTILLDGAGQFDLAYEYTAVVRGDQKSFTIAAASVVAKAILNDRMRELDDEYPKYGFADHKGYSTRTHAKTLEKYGVCRAHRGNTKPVKAAIDRSALSSEGRPRT